MVLFKASEDGSQATTVRSSQVQTTCPTPPTIALSATPKMKPKSTPKSLKFVMISTIKTTALNNTALWACLLRALIEETAYAPTFGHLRSQRWRIHPNSYVSIMRMKYLGI